MAEWLLGVSGVDEHSESISPEFYWQLIDTELAAETQRADSVILHAGSATKSNQLLHLEFQSRPDRQMPERMLEYWIRLWRLHGKPIHQVVLYLKKTNSPLVQVDQLQVGDTRHRYGVVRLWEQDPLPLLQNPALLPDRVAAIENPVLQKEIAGGCHLLAGLGFSQELINAYFTMGILDDSVTYQAAVAEYTRRGRLEGEQRGRQQGLKEGERQGKVRGLQLGLNQGLNQGLRQEAQSLVLRQLPRRCGQLSHEQELAVRALPLEKLEALAEALLDFDGPEALDAWLAV